MIKKIIVHGLHYYTTEATIREKFSEYGPVTDVSILKDSDGHPTSKAIVSFKNDGTAFAVGMNIHGTGFDRSIIYIEPYTADCGY